ncbi:MAG: tetratricopeptide repeat protein, partial [Oscillospiraceae bacterium]|nr:tetratricopeptide repeat protein [Oscillospiraceae bacterium]
MSQYDKGRMYFYMGDYQKAYLALEEAKGQKGVEAYLYLGKAYEATGDYNYASSVYNSYLSKNTGNATIYNQLGICEMQKGQYTKALDAFQKGLATGDKTMQQSLQFNEIAAYEHMGEYKKAAVLMESYIKNYPDDEKARREYEFLSTR